MIRMRLWSDQFRYTTGMQILIKNQNSVVPYPMINFVIPDWDYFCERHPWFADTNPPNNISLWVRCLGNTDIVNVSLFFFLQNLYEYNVSGSNIYYKLIVGANDPRGIYKHNRTQIPPVLQCWYFINK